MRKIIPIFLILFFLTGALFPAEKPIDKLPVPDNSDKKEETPEKKTTSVNVDAKMLYGQYDKLLWFGSIIQNFDKFTYQLTSEHKRMNDFGHKNTSFYKNEMDFTAKGELTKTWEITPEFEVNNASHGMFRNPYFNREGKDRGSVMIKNDIKPMPMRWQINLGGNYYNHRIDRRFSPFVVSSNFYRAQAEFSWEYIWSASNRLRFDSKFSRYFYSTGAAYDIFVNNEFIWNYKIAEYFMFSMGPIYSYNRDRGHFVSGKADMSLTGIKYFSLELSYIYNLYPFTPENIYLEQNFILPRYNVPSGKGHHAVLKLGVKVKRTSKKIFYVKNFKFKAVGEYLTNDRFYNYFSLPENVLTILPKNVRYFKARGEAVLGLALGKGNLELGANYEFYYFYALDNVTYYPRHDIEGYLKFSLYRFEILFNNRLRDRVYVHPYDNIKLNRVLLAYVTLQFKILRSFFLFGRIDNIYNSRYSTRYGYPEPGRAVTGGIRILI